MKKKYVFNSQFAIQNHERKFLVKCPRSGTISLLHEKEYASKNSFLRDVVLFDNPFDAEDYIWQYGYLEIDATLRPVAF